MQKKALLVILLLVALVSGSLAVSAQDMPAASVQVADQVSLNGTVTVASIYSPGPGFIVIHADNGGAPGPVIGHRALNTGWNLNVAVAIDAANATPTLYAMLHQDSGEVGVYEFGTVDGADGPVRDADGNVITPPFTANIIHAHDQFLDGSSVTIGNVVAAQDGWLVIHSDNAGAPGPVLGQTLVSAGNNAAVVVALSGDITPVLWPMLHVDTGAVGTYEFGTVDGADGPVRADNGVAVLPIWTVPHIRFADQIVLHGDAMSDMMMDMAPTVSGSALSDGPGWLVIHADNNGAPGPVLGQTLLEPGFNHEVVVELSGGITPVLWPMLHVDTGAAGTYEFGTVDGADGPVRDAAGNVITFAIHAAPSIVYTGGIDDMGTITVDEALIDAHGWLVIHANNEGAPGPVLGQAPLVAGLNTHIQVTVDPAAAGDQVFPMLHYDTGEAGVYEFGAVEGADGPVRVGEAVVVGPLSLGMMDEGMPPASPDEPMATEESSS